MNISSDNEKEWDKFLQENIVNKHPELYSDEENRKLLKELLIEQGEFLERYHVLVKKVQKNPEVARHLYEYMDSYPDLRTKMGGVNHELDKQGLRHYLEKHLGKKLDQGDYAYDPRNAELIQSLQIIQRYIETKDTEHHKLKGQFEGCPEPPNEDLYECATKLSNPEYPYKKQCEGTILERFTEEIYKRGLERARSNMRSELPKDYRKSHVVENPPTGEVTAGINTVVKRGIYSMEKRKLLP